MKLLFEKINLFEQVVGQLDDILAELNISDIESEIQSIFSESTSQGETTIKLNNLSAIINQATSRDHVEQERFHEN